MFYLIEKRDNSMMIMVQRLPNKVDHKVVVVIFSPKCSEEEWEEWVDKEVQRKENQFNMPSKSPLRKFTKVRPLRLLSIEIESAQHAMERVEWMELILLARNAKVVVWLQK
jgi:hypothetical protein